MIEEVAKQGRSWNDQRSGEGRKLRVFPLYEEIDARVKSAAMIVIHLLISEWKHRKGLHVTSLDLRLVQRHGALPRLRVTDMKYCRSCHSRRVD